MQKSIIFMIHGYNSNGEYMRPLVPLLSDEHTTIIFFKYDQFCDWPIVKTPVNTVLNRIRFKDIANDAINQIKLVHNYEPETQIHIVCHSNGLMLSYLASVAVDFISSIVSFNGALDADTQFSCPIYNFYCETDYTLKYLARLRPFHLWGPFGCRENIGAVNINLSQYSVSGHSDFMLHKDKLAPQIRRCIRGEYYERRAA